MLFDAAGEGTSAELVVEDGQVAGLTEPIGVNPCKSSTADSVSERSESPHCDEGSKDWPISDEGTLRSK